MAASSPALEYQERLGLRRASLAQETLARNRIGNARLLVFVILIALVWAWWADVASPWWMLPPALILVALIAAGSARERRMALARRAIQHYEQAIDRLEHRRNEAGETGVRFLDPQHPYSADLDLFGRHSLFQLLSVCRTRGGERKLADWLLAPATIDQLHQRHDSVRELRNQLDLREDLAVLGDDFRAGVNPEALSDWGAASAEKIVGWARAVAFVLSLIALALLIAWAASEFHDVRLRLALAAIGLIEAGLFGRLRRVVLRILEAAELPGHDLPLLAGVLRRLDRQTFACPELAQLHGRIAGASAHIAKLSRLVELAESRDNFFVRLFGPIVLWTTQTALAMEAWRVSHGPSVADWLDAVSEIEALSSLAAYAYEREGDCFPVMRPDGPVFDARALAHPLLPDCVPNDVALGTTNRLWIVSGSNMSGKSTLLRTVGVNCVLALAGAPVRAASLEISPLALGASIRTSDSLEGGISRFYAEILRLRQILDLPKPSLFLLDELLAGTNSHDRRIGAEALLKGLLARGAMGLATTHDLALAGIADSTEGAGNVHFEDFLEGGKIRFDYRMRPGVVERSNALALMRSIGLEV